MGNAHLLVIKPGAGAVNKYLLSSRYARLCGNLRGEEQLWLYGIRNIYAVSPDLQVREFTNDARIGHNPRFVGSGNYLYWLNIENPYNGVLFKRADVATGNIEKLPPPNMEIFSRDYGKAPVSDDTGAGFPLSGGLIAFGYSNSRRYPAMYSSGGLPPDAAIVCSFDPKTGKWLKIITGAFINRPIAGPDAVWAISPEEEYAGTVCALEPAGWQPRCPAPPLLRLDSLCINHYYPITRAGANGATARYLYVITTAGLSRVRWSELKGQEML